MPPDHESLDTPITLSLIVAMSDNRVIGRNNALPWKIPGDLQYFREVTWGKPIIMGRKTFESLKRPLPGRTNIVITRDQAFEAVDGVKVVHSLDEAIVKAQAVASIDSVGEIMIIGGAQIYELGLPLVNRMYITHVHAEIEGDAFFPNFDKQEWVLASRQDVLHDEQTHEHSYLVYDKR